MLIRALTRSDLRTLARHHHPDFPPNRARASLFFACSLASAAQSNVRRVTMTAATSSAATAKDFALPVVDFSSFLVNEGAAICEEPTAAQLATAKKVYEAGTRHGFVCLRNCGIDKNTLDSAFEASETLFSLSTEQKKKLKRLNVVDNTGYAPIGAESLNRKRRADLKESFNIRSTGNDFTGTSNGFKTAAMDLWDEVRDASRRYAFCCALALGLSLDYFSSTIDAMDLCTLRMLYYPPVTNTESDTSDNSNSSTGTESAIRIGEHTDFGLFTFLFVRDPEQASSHGLQVKAIEGSDLTIGRASNVKENDTFFNQGWSNVVLDEATLEDSKNDETAVAIVNTGALLARWTNDVWRATAHRVIVSPEAMSSHRYSIACFIDPDKETLCEVNEKFLGANEQPKYPPITSLEYLQMKLREAQGVE